MTYMEKESNTFNLSAITSLLGRALASPEIMGALTALLSILKNTPAPQAMPQEPVSQEGVPQPEPQATEAPQTSEVQEQEDAPDVAEVMALLPGKAPIGAQKREMLSAIRPYMNERRCQMIDRMVHAADLVQLLKSR